MRSPLSLISLSSPVCRGRISYHEGTEQLPWSDPCRKPLSERRAKLRSSRSEKADKIDWSRAAIDASFVRALGGGERTGPSPVDRRKKGSKHHVLTDGHGVPLAATTTAANVNEVTQLRGLVEAIPPVRGKPGRPRRRPDRLYGDRGYDSEPERRWLRRRGIELFLGGAVRSMAAGWGSTVGLWSGRCRGCMRSGNSGFGPTVEPIFIRRSCPSPARSFASFSCSCFYCSCSFC